MQPACLSLRLRIRRECAALFAIGLLACVALAACTDHARMNETAEAARVASPDGRLDAVLSESNPGATGSYRYLIHVVAHGRAADGPAAADLYGAIRNASAYGVDLHWQDDDTVVAAYWRAKSANLNAPLPSIDGRQVRVLLRAGVENASAPAGGMVRAPR